MVMCPMIAQAALNSFIIKLPIHVNRAFSANAMGERFYLNIQTIAKKRASKINRIEHDTIIILFNVVSAFSHQKQILRQNS